ncbi:MAG: dihydrolipoamide acetyltransferase family protein [Spirochaetia bacterium]|jgi:pyruvate dehydrogenase E2 component (dihydrolipoamide acetyltransferase)|nr:dihydrolipoamide acetyltransferase family protein [Spirochaetia bacterium]
MAEALVMIALSPTMPDGIIAEWLVKEGQAVKSGDALCEVETDKASMPYEASRAGTILKIVKAAGQKAAVGEIIAVLGKPGEDWQSVVDASKANKPKPASDVGEDSKKKAASESQAGNQLAFPALGPVVEPHTKSLASGPTSGTPASGTPSLSAPSSPLARRLARERGIDLRTLKGSGPRGRVIARDLEGSASSSPQSGAVHMQGVVETSQAGSKAKPRGLKDERVPHSKMRSIIAQRLSASWTNSPHFFVRSAIDMENLFLLRASINAKSDTKLSLNAFIMRLVATALERHPIVNASWEDDAIRYRPSADIGLAVSLDPGLITPVVRDCERKGVSEIDAELSALIPRARKAALSPEEYSNASFTVSNLGSFGVEEFTAIINPPGSAILAIGAIVKEAVVRNDEIVARRMMRITISCDHRVIDGALAAAFMAELKALLEEPALALV